MSPHVCCDVLLRFTTDLLGLCRTTEETLLLISRRSESEKSNYKEGSYNRISRALEDGFKGFVTHPNAQQVRIQPQALLFFGRITVCGGHNRPILGCWLQRMFVFQQNMQGRVKNVIKGDMYGHYCFHKTLY